MLACRWGVFAGMRAEGQVCGSVGVGCGYRGGETQVTPSGSLEQEVSEPVLGLGDRWNKCERGWRCYLLGQCWTSTSLREGSVNRPFLMGILRTVNRGNNMTSWRWNII